MGSLRAVILQLKRLICFFVRHRWVQVQVGPNLHIGCVRCRRLRSTERLKYTRKREKTAGDIERWMAANAPEGYSFVDCNWGKRKAKFVGANGQLKFVAF